jgi:hypothetical protein
VEVNRGGRTCATSEIKIKGASVTMQRRASPGWRGEEGVARGLVARVTGEVASERRAQW